MSVRRTYLAWYRVGLPTALTGAPRAGAARAGVPADISLRDFARTARIPVELAGPGDVAGLDPREIARREPYHGCPDAEPSYFPYVEFTSPDLPWRFSPFGAQSAPLTADGANVTARWVPPWLALAVVPVDGDPWAGPATLVPAVTAAGAGLPVLECDAAALPDPAELWAWAHVQVTTMNGEDPMTAISRPGGAVARLVCPRRLASGLRYLACLVPAFAAGAAVASRAGPAAPGAAVIHPATADPLAPAWGTTGVVRLPVYASWSFTTGPGGSCEALARRLRPRPAPAGSAGVEIDTSDPGWGVTGVAGASMRMQGALRPLADPAAHGAAGEPAADPDLAHRLAVAVSSMPGRVELRPPLYGQDYASGVTNVDPAVTGWLTELNTDPRRRVAAGLAAWAVAVQQEDFADRAWQQLSQSQQAPPPGSAQAADPQLAATVTAALTGRHSGLVPARAAAALGVRTALAARTTAGLAGQPGPPGVRAAAGTAAAGTAAGRFAPTFEEPAFAYLRALAPQWLLPGIDGVPEDSVVVLRTNPAFAEAYLIGLNHSLCRELAWRRFPIDPAATPFTRFWPGTESSVPPIASWAAASSLGTHSTPGDELVLLIRGAVLRRFPTASVYLAGARADGSEVHLAPTLSAWLGVGTALFGFPLTSAQALHPDPAQGDPARWFIVVQESVDHARFGLDDAPASGSSPAPHSWQDLDWSSPQVAGHAHVCVRGPLVGTELPLSAAPGSPRAAWASDAGALAAILQQPAFRIRMPVALWLGPQPTT
jgi:hypothetical protein